MKCASVLDEEAIWIWVNYEGILVQVTFLGYIKNNHSRTSGGKQFSTHITAFCMLDN